jgi:DNA-directed RNA polymerase specialized sigma subunit
MDRSGSVSSASPKQAERDTMGRYNYAEQRRLREEMAGKRKEYQNANMCEEKILELEEYDSYVSRGDRTYQRHTQSLSNFKEGMEDDGRNPLFKKFLEAISVEMQPDYSNPFWWFDTLENEKLITAISMLSDQEKMLLTLHPINEYSLQEMSLYMGCSKSNVWYQVQLLYEKIRNLMGGSI